MNGSLE